MLTRRQLVKRGAAGYAGLVTAGMLDPLGAFAASPVAKRLKPYVDRMPTLLDNVIDASGARGATYDVTIALVRRKVHKQLPAAQFFGFLHAGGPGISDPVASYLAPTFVAKQNVGFNVRYHNKLAPHDYLKVFKTPGALGSSYIEFAPHPEVRILTHLHGGFVAGKDDGNPYQNFDAVPSGKVQAVRYPNQDRATLLWYHDHYQGDTRMNVVAGLAGGFLVRDRHDTGNGSLGLPHNVSGRGLYEFPLVIQDRRWNPDGSLLYPVAPRKSHGPWISEYFGDTMLVNGKIWPYLVVDPCLYRFRILNGCNARILSLNIPGTKITIIGSEVGFLPAPVGAKAIVMAPAERYDVLVDFSALAGKTAYMQNHPPAKPVSGPAPPLTPVMQFRVNHKITGGGRQRWPGVLPTFSGDLRVSHGPPKLSGGTVPGRTIALNELGPDTREWKLNLNATPFGGKGNTFRQTLQHNAVEDWYYVNTTEDTHPMHTHLFSFQVMGRYNYDVEALKAAFGGANGVGQIPVTQLKKYLRSSLIRYRPEEAGFKDTVNANPHQITVVRAKYSLPSTALSADGTVAGGVQRYVHHCHIVEHEDNDMMERFAVVDHAPPPPQ